MATSFNSMTKKDANGLMIVDSLNLAFRYAHAKSVDFADDYIKTVKSLQQSYKCSKVIMACDMGSSSYRKAIYPEYKANRKEKYETQTPEEAQYFKDFLIEFERTMELIKEFFPVVRYDKVEADDIAAYIVDKAQDSNIWLISSDRDWDLLVSPTTSRFSYVTRKEVTFDNWATHYDCLPEDYVSIKAIQGDTGDNIFGIKGMGPKRSSELIKEYGSVFDVIAALPIASKYKHIQELNKSKDVLILNLQLMDLVTYCADAIGEDNCIDIDVILDDYLA